MSAGRRKSVLANLTGWALTGGVFLVPTAAPAEGEPANPESSRKDYEIPAGSLAEVLRQFSKQSGVPVSADDAAIAGLSSHGLRGNYGEHEALEQLLRGSGYTAMQGAAGFVLIPASKSRPHEEMIVLGIRAESQQSATKTSLSIRETPQAISVTTRESMDARQVRDLTTALELSAGVTSGFAADGGPFAGRGLGGGEGFFLRGQDLDGKRDVRMDGFMVASRTFDMVAFERVEVVKGPSSVLYGQGSLGGFINLVRRKPQDQRFVSAVVQAGSFDTYRGELDAGGALDADGKILGRLTAAYDDSGSFIDHVDTRTAVIAPGLEVTFGNDTRVLAQLLYQHDDYTPSRGMPLRQDGEEAVAPEIPRSLFTGVPSQEESSGDVYLATLQIDQPLGDKWLASLLLQKSGLKHERFFDAYANAYYLDTSGNVYMYSDTAAEDDDNWAGELRLDGRFDAFGREHRVLLGFDHSDRSNELAFGYTYLGPGNLYTGEFQEENVIPGGAGNQPFDFDFGTDNSDQGVYGQLLLGVLEHTRLLLGARYDFSDIKHLNNNTGQLDAKKDKELTLRVGLTHDVNDNITAYGVFAQSFNPTVDARSESGRILEPVTGEGIEVGLKGEWFDGRLGANLAVYRQELDNIPITDPDNHLFSINGGLQRTDGIEVELTGSPVEGMTVGAAGAWLDSEFIDHRDESYGLTPWGTIKGQGSIFASYELQSGPLHGLGFGGTFVSVGKRWQFDPNYVAGYERFDLNFYYTALPQWNFSLQIRNVTDERYVERVRDRIQDNFFGAPRAVLFRSEYRFDF